MTEYSFISSSWCPHVLSGDHVARLKRRALSFLEEAGEARKAVLYKFFNEAVRGHRLRGASGFSG